MSYNCSYTRIYNIEKIIKIQSCWRQYKLRDLFINKYDIYFNKLISSYLKLPNNIDYYKLLTNKIENNICIYDKKIIKMLTNYQKILKITILSQKYNKEQLSNNIKKLLLITIINKTIIQLNNLFIDINDLESITKLYLEIYNSNIENKYDTLKIILKQHIHKTESILGKYNDLGYNLLETNVKSIENLTYLKMFNKYISNVTNSINVNNIYYILSKFMTAKELYNYIIVNKSLDINCLSQNNILTNIHTIMKNIY